MFFRIPVAAELVVFVLTKTTQTSSPSQDCQPCGWPWDTWNTQAPLAKIDIRCENYQSHFKLLAGGESWTRAASQNLSGHGCPANIKE